jgi:hypothetical protein
VWCPGTHGAFSFAASNNAGFHGALARYPMPDAGALAA